MWGIKPSSRVLFWWGARAILQRNSAFDTFLSSRAIGRNRSGRMLRKRPNRYLLDLLWDRQGFYFRPWEDGAVEESVDEEQKKDRQALSAWVNKVGLKKVMEEFDAGGYDQGSDVMLFHQDEAAGYFIMANPQRSHGYMYLCAGKIAKKD